MIRINPELKAKLDDFIKHGGKILASGKSGLWTMRDAFAYDFGVKYVERTHITLITSARIFEMEGLLKRHMSCIPRVQRLSFREALS